MRVCSYCGRENDDSLTNCKECGTELDLPASSSNAPNPAARKPIICPKCGAADSFKPAVELRTSFSPLAFLAGGLLAVAFRNCGQERRVQCTECETLFGIRTPFSKAAKVIFWLLVSPTILVLAAFLLIMITNLFKH